MPDTVPYLGLEVILMDEDTMRCAPPDGCDGVYGDFISRMMSLPDGAGKRRETTAQRDARERGEKSFNARGCK